MTETMAEETWLPFDNVEVAQAAGFTSGTLSNGDTFGDEDDPNPDHWLYDARCDPVLFRSEFERLQTRNAELEKKVDWKCKARGGGYFGDDDCNWPHCGCDPHAERVIDGLREHGFMDPDQVKEFEKEIREETKDEVERLQARVAELEKRNGELEATKKSWMRQADSRAVELVDARFDADRLCYALEVMRNAPTGGYGQMLISSDVTILADEAIEKHRDLLGKKT